MSADHTTNTNILKEAGVLRCRTPRRISRRAHLEAFSPKLDGHGHRDIMRFPIVIHKDPNSDYGVTIPDLPGCFSAGETTDAALSNAVEAIECHVEGLLLDGEKLPVPDTIERYRAENRFSDGIWALVEVDVSKLSGRAKRVNITLPRRVLNRLDALARAAGGDAVGLYCGADAGWSARGVRRLSDL